jgi:hypothetical protein
VVGRFELGFFAAIARSRAAFLDLARKGATPKGVERAGVPRHVNFVMTPDECKKRAQECVEIAQTCRAPQREKLLQLAEAWLKLADGAPLHPIVQEPEPRSKSPADDK